MAARILLVEDNEELAAGIRHNLQLEGYDVEVAGTGTAGVDAARRTMPDLLILDIMLPEMDGFQVLRTLRADGFDRPVLILTARGEEADKVRGFRLDADQYVTKPFGLLELLERVAALLRRRTSPDLRDGGPPHDGPNGGVIRFGAIVVDPAARRVTRSGEEVQLTPRAYALLMALIRNEGRVLTRQDLLRDVWGHIGAVVTRTVDSHVSELRQKLEDDPSEPRHIHTVWKVGYRFER
ncbi:MAG: response regulator transcription factor [Gemmatimonadetes bacterium]|nr:response regulator transcription factor [Gemmatimonadota bacterium]